MAETLQTPDDYNPYTPPASGVSGRVPVPLAEGADPVTSVTYRLTPEDVREAQRGIAKAKEGSSPRFHPFLFVLVIVSFAVTFYFAGQPKRPGRLPEFDPDRRPLGWFDFAMIFAPALIIVALLGLVVWGRLRWRRGQESPHEITVAIDPQGVRTLEGDFFEARSSWTRCSKIHETPSIILIFTQNFDPLQGKDVTTAAYPIPRRAFATPEAAASFLETARRWHAEAITAGLKSDGVKPAESRHN